MWRGAKTWRLAPALSSWDWPWLGGFPWGGSRYVATSLLCPQGFCFPGIVRYFRGLASLFRGVPGGCKTPEKDYAGIW